MSELYPMVKNSKFRGDGYFTATVSIDFEGEILPSMKSAAFYRGDELIIQMDVDGYCFAVAVKIDSVWRQTVPTYEDGDTKYRVRTRFLEDIRERGDE